MATYRVEVSNRARKALRKIDHTQARIILGWVSKHLEGCHNPRAWGKPLTGDKKGYWRYRVGLYRLIAEIEDSVLRIVIVGVGHRKDIYE